MKVFDTSELKQLTETMDGIGQKKAKRVMQNSTNAGGRAIRKAVKSRIWISSVNSDRKSIRVYPVKKTSPTEVKTWITIRGPKAHIVRFYEYGYNTVATGMYAKGIKKRFKFGSKKYNERVKFNKKGKQISLRKREEYRVIGRQSPRPMVRPGFYQGKDKAIDEIGNRIGKDIAKAFKKLGR